MNNVDNSKIERHLGKTSEYKSIYDNSLLVSEPRQSNRNHLNINDSNLPFIGHDIWNGYEVSFLLNNGLPVSAIAKVTYSANSKYIVESKSMKLYWNSFNMTKMGATEILALNAVKELAAKDLSNLLETEVVVNLFLAKGFCSSSINNYQSYITLEDIYKPACTVYSETPDLLKESSYIGNNLYVDQTYSYKYHSSLLKSNCRVTSQPDWGDVYIKYTGTKSIDGSALLQYIISFRDECHFHEEICETIYTRIWEKFKPLGLLVKCLYVRRGGWDINPIRASDPLMLADDEINPRIWSKTDRQ